MNEMINKFKSFYDQNRADLLSPNEVDEIANSLYSLFPFGTLNAKHFHKIKAEETVLFGFKSGLLITEQQCHYFYIHSMTNSVSAFPHFKLADITTEKQFFKEKLRFGSFQENFKKFEISMYIKLRDIVKAEKAEHDRKMAEIRRADYEMKLTKANQ